MTDKVNCSCRMVDTVGKLVELIVEVAVDPDAVGGLVAETIYLSFYFRVGV